MVQGAVKTKKPAKTAAKMTERKNRPVTSTRFVDGPRVRPRNIEDSLAGTARSSHDRVKFVGGALKPAEKPKGH